MNIRRFRSLHAAGATYAEIARECGVDWRTGRKYLAQEAFWAPPAAPARVGTQPQLIGPYVEVVEAWLRTDVALRGTVIHERLVAEHDWWSLPRARASGLAQSPSQHPGDWGWEGGGTPKLRADLVARVRLASARIHVHSPLTRAFRARASVGPWSPTESTRFPVRRGRGVASTSGRS